VCPSVAEQERVFIGQRIKDALKAVQQRAYDSCVVSQAKIERRSSGLVLARAAKKEKASQGDSSAKINPYHVEIAPHVEQC
jgi:hypothetical protein